MLKMFFFKFKIFPHFFPNSVFINKKDITYQSQPKSVYKYMTLSRVTLLMLNKICEYTREPTPKC